MSPLWLGCVLFLRLISALSEFDSFVDSNQLSDGTDLYGIGGCDRFYYQLMERHVQNEKKFGSKHPKQIRSEPLNVTFHLYTQRNPTESQSLTIGDVQRLKASNFNSSLPTRFIVHGFCNCLHSEFCKQTRSAQLRRQNCNIITISWPSGSWPFQYLTVISRVRPASEKVAAMIDFLYAEAGLDLGQLYLIGHSLGAHLSGLAAKKVKSGTVNSIVGLDPANPGFYLDKPKDRLAATDAANVEVIHTNGGYLGIYEPIGTTDFYPNGGYDQPGCWKWWFGSSCSHGRAWEYYVESIVSEVGFWSTPCATLDQVTPAGCRSSKAKLKMGGEPIVEQGRGILTVPTRKEAPFAEGKLYRKEIREKVYSKKEKIFRRKLGKKFKHDVPLTRNIW